MFKRQTQIVNSGYGANNIAYLPDFPFPLYNFFGTSGIIPRFRWRIMQPEQQWVNPITRIIGNPGIQNGMSIGQPQLDTRGINGL